MMLYNRYTGIFKFGNNTYPRRIRHRSNLGHIFRGGKDASYGLGNVIESLNKQSVRVRTADLQVMHQCKA